MLLRHIQVCILACGLSTTASHIAQPSRKSKLPNQQDGNIATIAAQSAQDTPLSEDSERLLVFFLVLLLFLFLRACGFRVFGVGLTDCSDDLRMNNRCLFCSLHQKRRQFRISVLKSHRSQGKCSPCFTKMALACRRVVFRFFLGGGGRCYDSLWLDPRPQWHTPNCNPENLEPCRHRGA